MKPVRRTRHLVVEALENRHLLSVASGGETIFDPSPFEQEMLEHLNRFRLAPQAELDVLFTDVATATARDPDAQIAIGVFKDPSAEEIQSDWAGLSPVAPLAWNSSLYKSATNHTKLMVVYDDQSHLLPGEPSLGARLAAAGYQGSAVGENVFAYMNTVFHGHSAFAIDWGVADRSHRDNLMASTFREVGISIVADDSASTQVGPLLVTQDFGDGYSLEEAYLLGVVYNDTNGNGWYDANEGLGGVELLIEGAGGTYLASSMSAGGYQALVPPGVYDVTAYGGSLPSPMVVRDVVVGKANVKVDFEYDAAEDTPPLVDLNGPGEAGIDFQTTYFEGWGAVPIVAADATIDGSAGDRPVLSLAATITNHLDPQEYLAVDTTGTPITADYDAPAGILTLSGSASAGVYQQVLRTLVYDTLGSDPQLTPRQVEIVAFNGAQSSSPATVTVNLVAAKLPRLAINDIRAEENPDGTSDCSFTVSLSEAVGQTVTVEFETRDDSARAGEDFQAVSQTVVFAPGETVQTVRVPLIDDDLAEEDETFFGILSSPSGAVIADGTGVATIVDDDVAIKLGSVDFLGIEGIDLSQSPLYRFTTTRDGLLSIDVLAGVDDGFQLMVYDRFRSPAAAVSVASSGGHARLDLAGVPAGETYYVEVVGAAGNGRLLLGNVVRQEGTEVTVEGTRGDDTLEFVAGPSLWFKFNGLEYVYARSELARLVFRGGEGKDQSNLTGSASDDVARLSPGEATLSGPGYEVTVIGCEQIHVEGGGGEGDTASLFDSAGDDVLVGGPAGTGLSGAGFANTVAGFPAVLAYSTQGGTDLARLVGGLGDEEFVGKPEIGKLIAADSYLRVKLFDKVVVQGGGGIDSARIYGNAGSETFIGGPRNGELIGDGFHMVVDDYMYIHAYSRGGAGDRALLTGSAGDDTLVATPLYAKLFGQNYLTRAKFFPKVQIVSPPSGSSTARLYDSQGDDTVVLNVTESQLAGPGFDYRLRGFGQVTAFSDAGGLDTAKVYDTAGDDLFTGRPGDARLSGAGFSCRALRFPAVYSYSVAGGSDTAELYDSAADDLLLSKPDFTWIEAGGYFVRAKFFDVVHAYSGVGGRDTARFYADRANPYFEGRATVSAISEIDRIRAVNAFAEVYAEAGEQGGAALLLGSGSGDDQFESGENWARVSNPTLDFLIEVRGFAVDLGQTGEPEGSADEPPAA